MMQSYIKAISSLNNPPLRVALSITSNPSFHGRSCLQICSCLTRRHFIAPFVEKINYELMISPFFRNTSAHLIQEELKDTSFILLYFFTDRTKHTSCCDTC